MKTTASLIAPVVCGVFACGILASSCARSRGKARRPATTSTIDEKAENGTVDPGGPPERTGSLSRQGGSAPTGMTTGEPADSGTGKGKMAVNEPTEPGAVPGRGNSSSGQADTAPRGLQRRAAVKNTVVPYTALLWRIRWSFHHCDLAKVERHMKEAEAHWDQGDRILYFEVMHRICWGLRDGRFGDMDRQYDLLRQCVESVFQKEPSAPLELERRLMRSLMADTGYVMRLDGDARSNWRSRTARLVFRLWRRIATARDPGFDPSDPDDRVPITFCPPAETMVSAGLVPPADMDPRLRRLYDKARAEYKKRVEEYNRQCALRLMWRSFSQEAERYVIGAYSRKPHKLGELREFLGQYGLEDETKTRILKGVRDRITGERSGASDRKGIIRGIRHRPD